MVWERDQKVQRPLHYAIVDEVDNILVDEARTPLIISGPAEEANQLYGVFAVVAKNLVAAPKPDDDDDADPDADVIFRRKIPRGHAYRAWYRQSRGDAATA